MHATMEGVQRHDRLAKSQPLDSLPPEIWSVIGSHLDVFDIVQLSRVNHAVRTVGWGQVLE